MKNLALLAVLVAAACATAGKRLETWDKKVETLETRVEAARSSGASEAEISSLEVQLADARGEREKARADAAEERKYRAELVGAVFALVSLGIKGLLDGVVKGASKAA